MLSLCLGDAAKKRFDAASPNGTLYMQRFRSKIVSRGNYFFLLNHYPQRRKRWITKKRLLKNLLTSCSQREKALIVEDRKLLIADYRDRLDVKTVQAAIRIAKIKAKLDSSNEEIENILKVAERNISV